MTANTACKGETGVRPPLEKNLRAATCVTLLPLGSPEQMTPWARRTSRVWGSRPFEDGHAGGFPVETGYSHQRRDRGSRRTGRPGARSLPVARERSTRRTPVRIEASSPPRAGRSCRRGGLADSGFLSRGGRTPVSPLHAVFAVMHPGVAGSQGRPVSLSGAGSSAVPTMPPSRSRTPDEALQQALEELDRLGAHPAAAIAARRLRERGVRGIARGARRILWTTFLRGSAADF
jgi:hypothetical protein